jgi:hypothetical protein
MVCLVLQLNRWYSTLNGPLVTGVTSVLAVVTGTRLKYRFQLHFLLLMELYR